MSEILLPIVATILTGIVSYVSMFIKKFIEHKIKVDIIEKVVKYVEQVYPDLKGEEKFNKAVEAAVDILSEKKIEISETEIKMLIEAYCCEFCNSYKGE